LQQYPANQLGNGRLRKYFETPTTNEYISTKNLFDITEFKAAHVRFFNF